MKLQHTLGLVLLALALLAAGCAEQVGDIDRTQMNKLKKSQFGGVWYSTATVLDAPQPSAVTFIGEMPFGTTGKLMWDIQETMLVAYPVVEYVEGSEQKWQRRQIRNYWNPADTAHPFVEVYTGNPVAAFEIESQFDVKRQYNASTGEQTNVIEENTTDRKWYERDYIRVNWAKNLVSDFTFLAGATKNTSISYYVQEFEADNPDRPNFTPDYMDYVLRYYVEPDAPEACSIYTAEPYECVGTVIKVRYAFKKAPVNSDYIPWNYANWDQQELFGYFLTERYGYSEDYGLTYHGKVSLINRWNIWEHSRQVKGDVLVKDADGNDVGKPCLYKSDCDEAKGEFCQQEEWFTPGTCVTRAIVPVGARTPRPIVYHLSAEHPKQLLHDAYEAADQWDDIFRDTVAWMQYWDGLGQYDLRTCETNADCNQSALFDDYLPTEEPTPCAAAEECGDNADCTGGLCKKKTPCDADNPCFYGQSCSGGFCRADGALYTTDTLRQRAHTAVFVKDGDKAKPLYLIDNNYGAKDPAKAAVRLVNAAPGGQAVDLVAVGADNETKTLLTGVAFDAATNGTDYAMLDPRFSHFKVVAGGSELASVSYVEIKAGENHLFVYGGGDKLVHLASTWSPQGLRFVNAIEAGSVVDVAVNGSQRAKKLGYLEATDYSAVGSGDQRVTIVPVGQRTDVTCYNYNSQGYCVGWMPADDDQAVVAAVRVKKNALPSMFVACENVFSGDGCTKEQAELPWSSPDRKALLDDCRYAFVDKATQQIDNLCKKWVREPYAVKKHGDIRYSFFYWIEEEQAASPLGYGPSVADPDTGEIFHGIAHIYGAPLITYYKYSQDLIDLVNGKRSMDDLISGQFIADYVANRGSVGNEGYGTTDTLYSALAAEQGQSRTFTPAELAVIERMTYGKTAPDAVVPQVQLQLDLDRLLNGPAQHLSVHAPEVVATAADPRLLEELHHQIPVGIGEGLGASRLARAKGTVLDDILSNNEFKLLLNGSDIASGAVTSLDGGVTSTGDLTAVEYLLQTVARKERDRLSRLSKDVCVITSDFMDDALVGTAMELGCNLPPEVEQPTDDWFDPNLGAADRNGGTCPAGQICTCLEGDALAWGFGSRYYGGVLEHEVGHTVGLRHNFNSSNDVFNFRPEYYAARTKHLVPCRARDGRDGCEVGQQCLTGCATDTDCFEEHRCVQGKCLQPLSKPETYALGADGLPEEMGVCAWKPGYALPCGTSADCPPGAACSGTGQCIAKASKACNGFASPCDEGQVCDGGTCKVKTANGLDLPEVTVSAPADDPRRVFTYIPKVGLDENEQVKNRAAYHYASIMDYGGRINFDVSGLGMYDRAAIKMGYGALRDVYAVTDIARRYVKEYAAEIGYPEYTFAFYLGTDFWRYAGGFFSYYHPLFFFNYLAGGPAFNYRRVSVPYYRVKFENDMAKAFNRENLDATYMPVPYHYMGDEWRGNTGCYTWDIGIDMGEITYHMYNNLHDYYIFDAFKRESYTRYRGGSGAGYLGRILERWLPPLKDAGMSYAFMVQIMSRYSDWELWRNNRFEGWEKSHTAEQSFRYLANLLSSPWPGSFQKTTTAEGLTLYKNLGPWMGQQDSELDIPIGEGKFPYTTFWMNDGTGKQIDYGYYFFEHPLFIGSFWEKFGALLTLTDSTANFLSDYVGESLAVGVGTSIGFNTVFQTPMTNLLGGIVADDLGRFAGWVDTSGPKPRFVYRDPFDPGASEGKPLVEPSIHNLTLQTMASMFGMVYMPAAFNTDFIDSLAVFIAGSGDEYALYDDPNFGVERVTFTDPFGLKTYVAYKANFGGERVSPAYDLVLKAQAAADAWADEANADEKAEIGQTIKRYTQSLDMLRVLHRVYGTINY